MIWSFEFWKRTLDDPTAFWTMVLTLTTIVLLVVAYRQLSDLARTSKGDFLFRLKNDFFTEETRRLIFLLDNDLLEFRPSTFPYFEIVNRGSCVARLAELGITYENVSVSLIEDLVLGPLEDVGLFVKLKRITLEEAYEEFDSYIQLCAESKAIQAYLRWEPEDYGEQDDDAYDNFQILYERLKTAGPKIRAKKRKRRPRRTRVATT